MALEGYFDESERPGGVFCVAGYAFAPPQAHKFIKQWSRLFGAKGAHMVDLVAGRKQFEGMPQGERDRLIREAVKIINSRITAGIMISCNLEEVRSLSPRWIRGFGDAYPICCHLAMLTLVKWLDKAGISDRVTYVFESGHRFEGEANDFLRNVVRSSEIRESYRYIGHAFLPKRQALPLQAADMLAWEWTKVFDETIIRKIRPLRKSLRALLMSDTKRYSGAHITGPPLAKFMLEIRDLGLSQLEEQRSRQLHSPRGES